MPDKAVESADEKLMCPLTFNHPDVSKNCRGSHCAQFDRIYEKCAVLSQPIRAAELVAILQDVLREMIELRIELQRMRGEMAHISGAIVRK